MRLFTIAILLCFSLTSCKTTHFEKHKGLTFKAIDWSEKTERPFIVNNQVNVDLGNTLYLYLPANLFTNTKITWVYYDHMKSSRLEYTKDGQNRIKLTFDRSLNTVNDVPYELEIDQAVVVILVDGHSKTIKLEDIRVPFYKS
jgi:hypothetical protein